MEDEPFYLRYGQRKGRQDGISPETLRFYNHCLYRQFVAGLTFFEINCVFVE